MKSSRCFELPRSAKTRREKSELNKVQVRCASACACGMSTCTKPPLCPNVQYVPPPCRVNKSARRSQSRNRRRCCRRLCAKCILSLIFSLLAVFWIHGLFTHPESAVAAEELGRKGFNPCCAYPCQNHGVCTSRGSRFECDCTGTGYSGQVCQKPSWSCWMLNFITPSPQTLQNVVGDHSWFWSIVNIVPFFHRPFMKMVFVSRGQRVPMPTPWNTLSEYITSDNYYNRTMYARALPPIPRNCPTVMGMHGPKKLPTVDEVFERIFKRRNFIPCPHGTNLYFVTYAQFFTHQFFRTDNQRGPGATYGNCEGVDLSQVYGHTEERRTALRSFKDGKLKTITVDGEDVPPTLKDTPGLFMSYPTGGLPDDIFTNLLTQQDRDVSPKWALGHPLFSMTPLLFVMSTLWVREHNRVCDVLKGEHPDWEDEQLYQTARLIVTGVQIKLTLTEYVQHLSQYKIRITYEPELLHGTDFQFQNRIFQEFAHLYHWHMLVPDILRIEKDTHYYRDLLFTNNSEVFQIGVNRLLASLFVNIAGKMTVRNHPEMFSYVVKKLLRESRELRIQSFNNYRRAFDVPPHNDFMDLTTDPELANELRQLYGEVNAIEFYVGLLAEKHSYSVTPPSMVMMGGSWAVKGLLSHPLGSPQWWKPSTFGGRKGFDIIRRSTLKDFICRNVRGGGCSKMHIGYAVPSKVLEAAQRQAEEQQKVPVMRQCCQAEAPEVLIGSDTECYGDREEQQPQIMSHVCPQEPHTEVPETLKDSDTRCGGDREEPPPEIMSHECPKEPHLEAPPEEPEDSGRCCHGECRKEG